MCSRRQLRYHGDDGYNFAKPLSQRHMSERTSNRANTKVPKIGRNDHCLCGSGLKFKRCCLVRAKLPQPRMMASKDGLSWGEVPLGLREKAAAFFAEKNRKEQERVRRFGHVRPQISTVAFGQRMVAVGSRLYRSDKWKFFPDFLRDYVVEILGVDWCEAEAAKPEQQQHPVIRWRAQAARYMNKQPAQPDGSRVSLPSGAFAAFNCFAYDMYVVDDNGGIDSDWLQRLKNREMFQGARHELFAEATCYRAGFKVEHEDEKDGRTKHAEFTARHVLTGQVLSIEAKSRYRQGVLGVPGTPEAKPNFRLGPLINSAVAKQTRHPLVIFVDTNLPFKWAERILGRQGENEFSRPMVALLNRVKAQHNDTDPYSMIIFSNHPHHYALEQPDPEQHLLSVVPQLQSVHPLALRSLHTAAERYGEVPNGFSTDEGEPTSVAPPNSWPKMRYDFDVMGSDVRVLREGEPISQVFSIADKDLPQAPSQLHEFLEDIGLSRVDAHMICTYIAQGSSIQAVFGLR